MGPNASAASRFPGERSCYNRTNPILKRAFSRFIGVDLGGGRGKTTAIAEIRSTAGGAQVVEVATRSGRLPWTDDTLLNRLLTAAPTQAVIAIDALLTQSAC